MDQRIDRSRYKVIPRSLIFIFWGSELLMIMKNNKSDWNGRPNALGGHIEVGETILEAAYRELEEESGICDVKLLYAGNIMIDGEDGVGVTLHLFKGAAESKTIKASEEGTLFWVDVDDISRIPVVEDLNELIPLMKKWKHGDPMIIGHYPIIETSGKRNIMHE